MYTSWASLRGCTICPSHMFLICRSGIHTLNSLNGFSKSCTLVTQEGEKKLA